MADLNYPFSFNSSIPSLQIVFESVKTLAPGATATVAHGLDFTPLVMVWYIRDGVNVGRSLVNSMVSFDDTNIYFNNTYSFTATASVKCFNTDIEQNITYSSIKTQELTVGETPTPDDIDIRDCILHSRCQSPSISKIIHGTGSISYTNPEGAYSIVLCFSQVNSKYIPLEIAVQSAPGFVSVDNVVTVMPLPDSKSSIIVLQDPLLIATKTEVTY